MPMRTITKNGLHSPNTSYSLTQPGEMHGVEVYSMENSVQSWSDDLTLCYLLDFLKSNVSPYTTQINLDSIGLRVDKILVEVYSVENSVQSWWISSWIDLL